MSLMLRKLSCLPEVRESFDVARAKGQWHAVSDVESAVRTCIAAIKVHSPRSASRLELGNWQAADIDRLLEFIGFGREDK